MWLFSVIKVYKILLFSASSKRRRWDSNPRALTDNLISSQARYDHFDTSPIYEIHLYIIPNFHSFVKHFYHPTIQEIVLPPTGPPIFLSSPAALTPFHTLLHPVIVFLKNVCTVIDIFQLQKGQLPF